LKTALKIALIAVIFSLSLSSCKEYIEEVKETIHSAEDNSVAEGEFASIYDVVDDFVSTNMTATNILPPGTIILLHDTSFADGDGLEFSIYFGELDSIYPLGVLCNDGKYRAGFLTVTVTNSFTTIGSVIQIVANHDNCFYSGNGEDMFKIQGIITATRTELNKVDIIISNALLLTDDYEINWESSQVLEVVDDAGPGFWGDTYQITGTSQGTNRFGQDYKATIVEPLIKKMEQGCANTFTEGVLEIDVSENNKTIFVDYDPYKDQKCDKIAQAEINGKRTIFKVK
jgi:hypothetical protein